MIATKAFAKKTIGVGCGILLGTMTSTAADGSTLAVDGSFGGPLGP